MCNINNGAENQDETVRLVKLSKRQRHKHRQTARQTETETETETERQTSREGIDRLSDGYTEGEIGGKSQHLLW